LVGLFFSQLINYEPWTTNKVTLNYEHWT